MRNGKRFFLSVFIAAGFLLGTNLLVYGQSYQITKDDYPKIGTSSTFIADTTGNINVVIGEAGVGKTWTFTQQLFGPQFTTNYVDPTTTTYGSSFPDAEWAFETKQWISMDTIPGILNEPIDSLFTFDYFEKYSDDTILGLGMATDMPFYQGAFEYTPPAVDYVLPLEYGKSWTRKSTFTANISISGMPITLVVSDSAVITVDGEGTLTIPMGTYQCLRLKSHRILSITAVADLGYGQSFTIPVPQDTPLIEYEWYTKKAGMLLGITSHSGETNENFTSAGGVTRLVASSVLTGINCDPNCRTSNSIPKEYSLGQNYPNPFNPTTTISYTLPEAARIELKVFNIMGQEVTVLETGTRTAGEHTVIWNGKDIKGKEVPPGIYFYQLKAVSLAHGKTFIQTKKMLMAK